jgi:hypothetical protein
MKWKMTRCFFGFACQICTFSERWVMPPLARPASADEQERLARPGTAACATPAAS